MDPDNGKGSGSFCYRSSVWIYIFQQIMQLSIFLSFQFIEKRIKENIDRKKKSMVVNYIPFFRSNPDLA